MDNKHTLNPNNWIINYSNALYKYTIIRVNDTGIAEDIVQETFLSAWRNKDNYKGEASEKNWLYTICKNKIIDHYRKKSTSIIQYAEADTTSSMFDDVEHWTKEDAPKEWGVNYNQTIEKKEFYSILEKCKSKLQQMQQSVFVMKYLEDLDTEEICKVLGITTSNYWVLIHRAKLSLRNCLEKNWVNI
ncbi:MAG: sigma-70 family RNA polymerase sigma factor [Flavobacterium sp.]|nr:sigma-70 family RNA polymerase sigma factor [Flavobacterium sp.]